MKRKLNWNPPTGTKIVWPSKHVLEESFTPSRGADVQATWRKAGWKPTFGTPTVEQPPTSVLAMWKKRR